MPTSGQLRCCPPLASWVPPDSLHLPGVIVLPTPNLVAAATVTTFVVSPVVDMVITLVPAFFQQIGLGTVHRPISTVRLRTFPTPALPDPDLPLPRVLRRNSPIVPPSVDNQQVSASSGTTGNHAPLVVSGITDVPFAVGHIQGAVAESSAATTTTTATTGNRLNLPFKALPLDVISPIRVDVLEELLTDYPCSLTRDYLLQGFTFGFDIGFKGTFVDLHARPRNLLSALNSVDAVNEAIRKELERGHTSGPFSIAPFDLSHCSPIGAAPKSDGSARLILDLSSPRGDSVNDGISQEEFKCKYSKFDDAVNLVVQLGPGAFMAKIDIKHAFRLCPVLPSQWPLLCFLWCGYFFVDTRLPFGSRSSPKIFNTFARALAWIATHVGGIRYLVHYLDDFFIANSSHRLCQQDMDTFLSFCARLGVPIAADKLEGPTTSLVYLGIEIDSVAMCIRLPKEKLSKLKLMLGQWSNRKKARKRVLLSLIGMLGFASKVVKPGRMLLRRLIDLSTTVDRLGHFITVNTEARADIQWWSNFLPDWNGISLIQRPPVSSADLTLFTDACNVGFGAVYDGHWFCSPWRDGWFPLQCSTNARELFAVWAAVLTWGREWENQQVLIYTDNMVVYDIWVSGACKQSRMLAIIRTMFFFAAKHNINILMRHIPGVNNRDADMLSRFQVHAFKADNPLADEWPTEIPHQVWDI